MANRVSVPVTNFESLSPPWSLASLDADLLALQGALNDSSLGYVGNGTDTGSANHYVVPTLSYGVPSNYNQGMTVAFIPAATNLAGASTLNVAGLGVQSIQYAGGNPPAGWIQAGQTCLVVYIGSAFQLVPSVVSGAPPPQCGRLIVPGASPSNTIQFVPAFGDVIKINGAFYQIPAAGITATYNSCYINGVAGQALTNNALYRVYLFNNAGTLTIDFSPTAHATSATSGNVGVEIKSGDDTRSFIGLVYTAGGSGQFYDNAVNRCTRSWFNPLSSNFGQTTTFTVTATTPTLTTISASVLTIANEALAAQVVVYGTATNNTNISFVMALDGVGFTTATFTTTGTTSKNETATVTGTWNPTEALHVVSLYASCSAANTFSGTGALTGIVG